jgi:ATP-dependent Clp protease ATP-binding subunit ClpA
MNNFTPRAQQVLALARKEADRFNHNYVGTEHLLLGLIRLESGGAFNVLQKLGISLENMRIEVEKQVGTGFDNAISGNIPYTPRVKKVLALACKEAKALGHSFVGTTHILLGLLREGEGAAARVMKTMGIEIEATRVEVAKEHEPNLPPGAAANVVSGRLRADDFTGFVNSAASGAIADSFNRLESEFERTRSEFLSKIETVMNAIDSLKTEITQLRTDMQGSS